MDETQLSKVMEFYHRRLMHHHRPKNMEDYNELYYAALTESVDTLRSCLFYASEPVKEGCPDTSNESLEDAYGWGHAMSCRV